MEFFSVVTTDGQSFSTRHVTPCFSETTKEQQIGFAVRDVKGIERLMIMARSKISRIDLLDAALPARCTCGCAATG